MTREEAIRILDPATTAEALAEIEYYGGYRGHDAQIAATDEACRIAVADMRKMQEAEKSSPGNRGSSDEGQTLNLIRRPSCNT